MNTSHDDPDPHQLGRNSPGTKFAPEPKEVPKMPSKMVPENGGQQTRAHGRASVLRPPKQSMKNSPQNKNHYAKKCFASKSWSSLLPPDHHDGLETVPQHIDHKEPQRQHEMQKKKGPGSLPNNCNHDMALKLKCLDHDDLLAFAHKCTPASTERDVCSIALVLRLRG